MKKNWVYVKSCNPCQSMEPLNHYRTNLSRTLISLFDVSSIAFDGPFSPNERECRFMTICIDHLKNWPIAVSKRKPTAEPGFRFVKDHILRPLGPFNTIVSDNLSCFTEKVAEEKRSHKVFRGKLCWSTPRYKTEGPIS